MRPQSSAQEGCDELPKMDSVPGPPLTDTRFFVRAMLCVRNA